MFRPLLLSLALAVVVSLAAPVDPAQAYLSAASSGIRPSFDTSRCPGYRLAGEPKVVSGGLIANLTLAGPACNAYGVDIDNLTLAVVFEKAEQLHVHLYDSARNQYQLPSGLVFDRPGDDPEIDAKSTAEESHLEFHHNGNQTPWAFWITRKSNNETLFDTRGENIPTYDHPMNLRGLPDGKYNSTKMLSHPIIFENQYLQISSALPKNANIYGLGEYVSAGFRRDNANTLQTFFTLDSPDPVDSNMYGYHPVYMEVRHSKDDSSRISTHAVHYQNTAGIDVLLREGVIQYRAIGGTLDFRFFSGDMDHIDTFQSRLSSVGRDRGSNDTDTDTDTDTNSLINNPKTAISQYVSFIGKPIMVPRWSLGFHLCRWGWKSANETLGITRSMKEHDIPLEVQWNDIDYLHQYRAWTHHPAKYSQSDLKRLFEYLQQHKQKYIPIFEAGIAISPPNGSSHYYPAEKGIELDVFMKNANETNYIGQVWPGYTYFPSWAAPNTQKWWSESLRNFSQIVNMSGAWLDMNEPSSFCIGSCGSDGRENLVNTKLRHARQWGDDEQFLSDAERDSHTKRASEGDAKEGNYHVPDWKYHNVTQRYVTVPPYAIHNAMHMQEFSLVNNLNQKTVAMESLQGEDEFYDVKTLFGTLEEKAMYNAFLELRPNQRPFLISRSTYTGAGRYSHHWLGDNYSSWSSFWRSIQGILQFQLFGIPMVGPDVGGFNDNSNEELVNRWHTAAAMMNPFYRNHNSYGAISQEPFRWESTAKATRLVNYKRNELLPYYYSVMAQASLYGIPAVRSLWYEFPESFADTYNADSQVLFGPSLLVSPVFEPNVSTVKAYFPEAGGKWRNIFTYEALEVPANQNLSISAPLSTINAHMRPGTIMLTHAAPKYTTEESAEGPYRLLVNLDNHGRASGEAYVDDGISMLPTPSSELHFIAMNNTCSGSLSGEYRVPQKLSGIVILGVGKKPNKVTFDGKNTSFKYEIRRQMLNVTDLVGDMNVNWMLKWE